MNFSFNGTAGASQGTTFKKLEGNTIPVVKFDGCEVVDVQGVKDPTQVYRLLKLKFSNDEGTFEHTCFEPKPADFERRETDYTDKKTGETKKIPQPSNVESMMLLFKHAIDALNPVNTELFNNEKLSIIELKFLSKASNNLQFSNSFSNFSSISSIILSLSSSL